MFNILDMEAYLCVLTVWRLAEDLSGLYLARAGANQRGRGSAPQSAQKNLIRTLTHKKAVLRIQIRIRIRRIHIFLGLPDPFVRDTDPYPAPARILLSSSKNNKKNFN
jgi:hypothetical protein